MPAKEPEPSLMRNLGAFFGHIVQAIKEDPTREPPAKDEPARDDPARGASGAASSERTADRTAESSDPQDERNARGPQASDSLEVRREVQEARHGPYLLRRTTIDEVIRAPEGEAGPTDEAPRGDHQPRD